MSWKNLAVLLAVGWMAVLARPTQADPDLDRIAAESKLAAQKVEREVNFALNESRVFILGKDYVKAQSVLEKALTKVKNSQDLSDSQRTTLRQRLQTRLREVEQGLGGERNAADEAARKAAERAKRERENNKTNGSGVTNVAKDRITMAREQLAAHDRLKARQADARMGVLNSLANSAVPIAGEVEFPKYWAKLIESDFRRPTPKLSKKEAEVLKSLNSYMTPDFDKVPFKQVIEYLMEKTGQAILVDENSLKDLNIEYDDPVDFRLKTKITVRTILKKILGDKGLSYVIRDGTIQVMSAEKAKSITVVRSYPVADLVGGTFNLYDPFTNQLIANNVQSLIQTVQNAVEPGHWKENGGPGTITFHGPSGSLIIRASAEMHYMLGGGGFFK